MKRIVCLLAALLLMMSCAAAEEYVTLAELREQAKDGWNETYRTKRGEIVVNAEMDWFPEDAETCPVVMIEPVTFDETDSILNKYKEMKYGEVYVHCNGVAIQNRNVKAYRLQGNEVWRGKTIQNESYYYDGERPGVVPELVDISYDEFLMMCNDDLGYLVGLTLDSFHIDEIWVKDPMYKATMKNGELKRGDKITANGCYHLFARQLVQGIPVLGTNESSEKGYMSYHYYQPEYNYSNFFCVKEIELIEEDVPLLSFDSFKGKLEKLIDAGKLHGVTRIRFGYGTCMDGNTWKLVPIWLVEGGYSKDGKKDKVMPYTTKNGEYIIPEEYQNYAFSAQTGEMLERYALHAREDSLRMPKILTWDDVQ